MGWRFILSLGFSIFIAIFAIANAAAVRVNFIFAVYEVSQAIVILISAIAGAIIVMLLSIIKNIRLNMKINNQEKTIVELEKEKVKKETQFADLEKKYEELALEGNSTFNQGEDIIISPENHVEAVKIDTVD